MTTSKKQKLQKTWIRIICIFLIVVMVGSTVLAALGLF